jgi:hypothetical protein
VVDHPFDISFFLVQLVALVDVGVSFDLMELVEMELVVRVEVVNLFPEPVVVRWLGGTFLLAHQQL